MKKETKQPKKELKQALKPTASKKAAKKTKQIASEALENKATQNMKICIKGSKNIMIQEKIRQTFKKLRAANYSNCIYQITDFYYFINESGFVDYAEEIPEGYVLCDCNGKPIKKMSIKDAIDVILEKNANADPYQERYSRFRFVKLVAKEMNFSESYIQSQIKGKKFGEIKNLQKTIEWNVIDGKYTYFESKEAIITVEFEEKPKTDNEEELKKDAKQEKQQDLSAIQIYLDVANKSKVYVMASRNISHNLTALAYLETYHNASNEAKYDGTETYGCYFIRDDGSIGMERREILETYRGYKEIKIEKKGQEQQQALEFKLKQELKAHFKEETDSLREDFKEIKQQWKTASQRLNYNIEILNDCLTKQEQNTDNLRQDFQESLSTHESENAKSKMAIQELLNGKIAKVKEEQERQGNKLIHIEQSLFFLSKMKKFWKWVLGIGKVNHKEQEQPKCGCETFI